MRLTLKHLVFALLLPLPVAAAEKMCGVNWVAGGAITQDDILPLTIVNATWIAQTPAGWQTTFDSPSVLRFSGDDATARGDSDDGIIHTATLARDYGIKTMLRPLIWLADGKRPAEIQMDSEESWQRWFDSYGEFILHYARLAQEHGIEALCVGSELAQTAQQRPHDWRTLIAAVREIYSGSLLYAAGWDGEFEAIPFWDALDFAGIQAYFPLTTKAESDLEALQRGWRPHLRRIQRMQKKIAKPIIFTELGYRSVPDAAVTPHRWVGRDTPGDSSGIAAGLETQATCYEAFFRVFWPQEWFAGVFIWRWFPKHVRSGGPADASFTPQNKPAQYILRNWYGQARYQNR